jgi:hypothetical protein
MRNVSIIHIYVYGMIKRRMKGGNIIHISEIYPVIKGCIRIPRKYQRELIKELTKFEFLKRLGRDNYEILSKEIDPPVDSLGEPLW